MKKEKVPKFVLFILFLGFLMLYMADNLGYYDYQQHKKAILTEEKIKEFEEDIKNGKEVDKASYLEDTLKDYRNPLTKTCTNISDNISKYVKKGVESMFGIIGKLVGD